MDVEAARRALRSISDLNPQSITPIIGGWAAWTFEVDGEWIVRFPRNAYVIDAHQRELRLLPELARTMPFAVPAPAWTGDVEGVPFFGYRKIRGRPLTENDTLLADAVNAAIDALHGFSATRARELLDDPGTAEHWRAGYVELQRKADDRVAALLPDAGRLTAAFEDFLATAEFTPTLVHRDLGNEHVLIDEQRGEVAGIIDFEDAAVGDLVIDFFPLASLGRELGGSEARRFAHYRWLGALHAVLYGLEQSEPELVEDALSGLTRRLAAL